MTDEGGPGVDAKDRLWRAIEAKYPDGVDLTPKGTRDFFEKVWREATLAAKVDQRPGADAPIDFSSFFGKTGRWP